MANNLANNPVFIDTASGSDLTGQFYIQEIQWIDDNADIADADDLAFTFNGVSVALKLQVTDNTANNGVFYQAGPFPRPILAKNFVVTTIDHGVLLVWLA